MATKSEKRSEEEMQQLAIEKGVGEKYSDIMQGLSGWADNISFEVSSVAYYCKIVEGDEIGTKCLVSIYLNTSSAAKGLHMQVMVDRVARYLKLGREDVLASLTVAGTLKTFSNADAGEGYEFHLHATDNIDALIGLLSASQSKPAK
jgi:hypothetical protein